jgi:hypothetical protein
MHDVTARDARACARELVIVLFQLLPLRPPIIRIGPLI